jgi:hypothetical protein
MQDTPSRNFEVRVEGVNVRHTTRRDVAVKGIHGYGEVMSPLYKDGLDLKFFLSIRNPASRLVAECKWDNDLNFRHRQIGLVVRYDHDLSSLWHTFVSNTPRTLGEFDGVRCAAKAKPDDPATNRELTDSRGMPVADTAKTRYWFYLEMVPRFKDGGVSYLQNLRFSSKHSFRDLFALRVEGSGRLDVIRIKSA